MQTAKGIHLQLIKNISIINPNTNKQSMSNLLNAYNQLAIQFFLTQK